MIKKIWDNFEEYALVGSFFFIVPLLFIQIVMRYVFAHSLSWSEELARYIFLWQIWIGSSYAVKREKHIRIDIIKGKMSELAGLKLEILVIIVWMMFSVFLVVKGGILVYNNISLQQYSPALHLSMGIPYLSVPTGAALMFAHLVEKMILTRKRMLGLRDKEACICK